MISMARALRVLALAAPVFGFAPGGLRLRAAVHHMSSVSMAIAREGSAVPMVTFKTRVRIESNDPNPFDWKDVTSADYFKGKRCVIFALPGAFTPTCSSTHLPGYEAKYAEMKSLGIDEVYCLSVNDAFVMRQWGLSQGLTEDKTIGANGFKNVKARSQRTPHSVYRLHTPWGNRTPQRRSQRSSYSASCSPHIPRGSGLIRSERTLTCTGNASARASHAPRPPHTRLAHPQPVRLHYSAHSGRRVRLHARHGRFDRLGHGKLFRTQRERSQYNSTSRLLSHCMTLLNQCMTLLTPSYRMHRTAASASARGATRPSSTT